jgi:CubicO group peptidase (beta-lactamase class C family)
VRVTADGVMAFAWTIPIASIPAACGGGCSTVRDMAVFGQTFLDRGQGASAAILSPTTVQAMVTNQIPGVPGALNIVERHDEASWGYGWGIASHEKWQDYTTHTPDTFSHGGATGTYLWCDPTHELVGAYFAPVVHDKETGWPLGTEDLFVNAVTASIDN